MWSEVPGNGIYSFFCKNKKFFQVTMALPRPLLKPCLACNVKRRVMLVCGLKCQEMAFKWHSLAKTFSGG